MTNYRDNGGKLPTGIGYIKNTTGQVEDILGHNASYVRTSIPQHMWPKLPNIIALPDKPIIVTPLVTVRKINNMWVFKCSHCSDYSVSPYWKLIYSAADYHARNHHRSK